jgi:hypothetical protein
MADLYLRIAKTSVTARSLLECRVSTRPSRRTNVNAGSAPVVHMLGFGCTGFGTGDKPARLANDKNLPTNVELRLDVGTGPHGAISRRRPCLFLAGKSDLVAQASCLRGPTTASKRWRPKLSMNRVRSAAVSRPGTSRSSFARQRAIPNHPSSCSQHAAADFRHSRPSVFQRIRKTQKRLTCRASL